MNNWGKRLDFRKKAASDLRRAVFTRDDFTCQHCAWRPENVPDEYTGRFTIDGLMDGRQTCLHMDHVVPIANGGSHTFDNFQVLCDRCNSSKCNRPAPLISGAA